MMCSWEFGSATSSDLEDVSVSKSDRSIYSHLFILSNTMVAIGEIPSPTTTVADLAETAAASADRWEANEGRVGPPTSLVTGKWA